MHNKKTDDTLPAAAWNIIENQMKCKCNVSKRALTVLIWNKGSEDHNYVLKYIFVIKRKIKVYMLMVEM